MIACYNRQADWLIHYVQIQLDHAMLTHDHVHNARLKRPRPL